MLDQAVRSAVHPIADVGGEAEVGRRVEDSEARDIAMVAPGPVLAKTAAGRQVVDLSARIRREPQLDDHPPAPRVRLLPSLCGSQRQLALGNLPLRQQLTVYT